MCFSSAQLERLFACLPALCWYLDVQLIGQVTASQRSRSVLDLVERACRNHPSAVFTGTRTEVKNPVARLHDLGVMLDHQDGVSQVAQLAQNFNQSFSIATV